MISFERLTKKKLQDYSSILDKKYRLESGLFQIEGVRLFEEFLASGFEVQWIVVHSDFIEQHPQLANTIKNKFGPIVCQANGSEIQKLTDTQTTQGIVAGIRQKKGTAAFFGTEKRDMILALDGISDPGNLGTILRSADWFGVSQLVLSPTCADVYNPKTIRSSMGSIFRVNCATADLGSFLRDAKDHGYKVYASSLEADAELPFGIVHSPLVLVIGNEAHGISEPVLSLCDRLVKIPGYGRAESLNAAMACSILLYEFKRQLHGSTA